MPILQDGDTHTKSYDVRTLDVGVVPASGCSVKVEFNSGSDWCEDSQSPITSPTMVTVRGLTVRYTATGGTAAIADGELIAK